VKELAANDPLEMKMSPSSEEEPIKMEHNSALEDRDPARLRSLNEGEISADPFKFHGTMSQLQLQDEVLDCHTSVAEIGAQWTELDHALLNDVDYDGDAYSKQLELTLAESGYFVTSNRKWLRSERNSLLKNTQLKDTAASAATPPTPSECRRDGRPVSWRRGNPRYFRRDCRQKPREKNDQGLGKKTGLFN
jgi:hypothetical protein